MRSKASIDHHTTTTWLLWSHCLDLGMCCISQHRRPIESRRAMVGERDNLFVVRLKLKHHDIDPRTGCVRDAGL